MVRTSFLTDSKWSLRLFLLTLKKPSNVNLPVGSPDTANAEMTALGPGTTSTGTSCSAHNATRSSPGSEMAGMPASETMAHVSPAKMRSTMRPPFSALLCS